MITFAIFCHHSVIIIDVFFYFSGYSENFYRKDDEILVFHSHELPSMPATPYPCKLELLTPLENVISKLAYTVEPVFKWSPLGNGQVTA